MKQSHQQWQQGLALSKKQDWVGAVKLFERACQGNPSDTLYRLNLARAYLRLRRPDEAIREGEIILSAEPDNVLARQFMGECLVFVGRDSDAANVMLSVGTAIKPGADYFQMLGNILFSAKRYREAIKILLEGLSMEVDHAMSHYRLGLCFNAVGMKSEAVECLTTALLVGMDGGVLATRSLMGFINRELCQWDKSQEDLRETEVLLDALTPTSISWSSVFAVVTCTGDVLRQLRAAQACANFVVAGAKPLQTWQAAPLPAKLRVGMVSSDFHQHATTILMAELIEKMDRNRFELVLYSHGVDDASPMRQRIKAVADDFVEIGDISDEQAARRIRDDKINVLIDLKGHTVNGRLGIFAWRPAPVQVTYLGFPGTSGASYIDYMIGDPYVSPLSEAPFYSEKLALMPHCYQPNDRQRALPKPQSRRAHGLPQDALVLCGFNQPFKLSPEVFDLWCDLLKRLPHAVLWLLAWTDDVPLALRREAELRGVDPSRLIFAPKMHINEHISRFALADIYIDSWPCNGHTTVSDALWSGVPVVTYAGRSFASRVAASLLVNVGLPDLVCHDLDTYKAKILELAGDVSQRQALRAHLHRARDTAPLFNSDQYAHDFGELLWRMAERQAEGLPPDHIGIQGPLAQDKAVV
ncbi:MAG: tetratricopeptide repeat protein [Aquabacterium sp.]|nr:tetratricopeptide repeat protein [Aquabacterium sp.]